MPRASSPTSAPTCARCGRPTRRSTACASTEAERAALEERSRLAREIHDGLAQHLWFAKLKFERLAGTLSEEDQPLAGEVTQALDAAIVEAREALVTMRASLAERTCRSPTCSQRTVDDFGDRSGLRVASTTSSTVPTSLPPRVRVEVLLRIVSEALTNVRKHADATIVRVDADVQDGELLITRHRQRPGLRLHDEAVDQGLGLQGMQERARLIGGSSSSCRSLGRHDGRGPSAAARCTAHRPRCRRPLPVRRRGARGQPVRREPRRE